MVFQESVPPHPRSLDLGLLFNRLVLAVLIGGSVWFAAQSMSTVLASEAGTKLKGPIVGVFSILFGWIAFTFWSSFIGFFTLLFKVDPLGGRGRGGSGPLNTGVKVAVVMPVYNEETKRIYAGLQTMFESVRNTGALGHFDFFILSDSTRAEQVKDEEDGWAKMCREVGGFGKIFYRRRKARIHKKSGNIADFCRRWGTQYTYMVALDADSLMSGRLMMDMVRTMEARPDIGILQTAPQGINQLSLSSRLNQFTSYVYGPLLVAGAHFWQKNDGSFWGHNAIVRMEPFIKYCALPPGKGSPPFGGPILSHDFVEAALMRRAGWGVWLAYDMEESFEELPPHILEELERDRRWCRGNMQHLRLMFMPGFSFGHRLLFLQGNMFYFSSFLWFVLLVLMTIYAYQAFVYKPVYFPMEHSLFPSWPVQYNALSRELLITTVVFLFLPKFLGIAWVLISRRTALFGGFNRLIVSVICETVFSIFIAPIKMLFHAWFVLTSLLGGSLEWKKQARHSKRITVKEAFQGHWVGCVLAAGWGVFAFYINQTLFWWMSVIVVPLFLAMPISMLMSFPEAGSWFRRHRLFMTPVETTPPPEVPRFNNLYSRAS